MRAETKQALDEAFESRKGQFDTAHVLSLTYEQAEQLVRRVEREAREEMYKQFGVEPLGKDEGYLKLTRSEMVVLSETCGLTYREWGDNALIALLPFSITEHLETEREVLGGVWAKIDLAVAAVIRGGGGSSSGGGR